MGHFTPVAGLSKSLSINVKHWPFQTLEVPPSARMECRFQWRALSSPWCK